MRRLVYMSAMLLLLCSCATPTQRWAKTIEGMEGTHISRFITAWGKPEARWETLYTWSKAVSEPRGGYYYTSYEKVTHYDNRGRVTGYSEYPVQKYMEPWTWTGSCKINLYTNEQGFITQYSYTYTGGTSSCPSFFPLPEGK